MNGISTNVQEICSPFFDKSGLNAFSYSRLYADGSRSELWSNEAARDHTFKVARYIVGTYTPKFFSKEEKFSFLEKKVLSYPKSLRDRFIAQLNDQREYFDHDHCFAILNQNVEFCEYFLFYGPKRWSDAANYYVNNLDVLQTFAGFFTESAKDLVVRADQAKIVPPLKSDEFVENMDPPLLQGPLSKSPALTKREREVANLILRGMTSKEIGKELGLSPRTIESHVENMKRRLDCPRKSALVDRLVRINGERRRGQPWR
jgi:DNA-binding CsgD family transcriptional regulator